MTTHRHTVVNIEPHQHSTVTMRFGIKTHLRCHPLAAHHQGPAEGSPLVYVPQVFEAAHVHVHAHVVGRVLDDVFPGALASPLSQKDEARRRCLGRRRTLEAQSGALDKS